MPDLGSALTALTDLPLPLVLAAAGALALAECTIGLGFLVPGESGLLLAAASIDDVATYLLMTVIVAACATLGDTIGYSLGQRFGHRLRETRLVAKLGRHHWDRAAALLQRHGAAAVIIARFLPVVRTLTPAAAGASDLNFRRFLPAAALGALAWSGLHVGIGAAAGASARYIEDVLGWASWIVLALVILTVGATILVRRLRTRQHPRQRDTVDVR